MSFIKVLIVDDSPFIRKFLKSELEKDSEIKVISTAANPYEARDKIIYLQPDIITLDLEMPKMNGLVFLEKLMKYYPLPVIVISSYTQKGCYNALKSLELGAVDVFPKPNLELPLENFLKELKKKIKIYGRNLNKDKFKRIINYYKDKKSKIYKNIIYTNKKKVRDIIIAIGASLGGPEAIRKILVNLPSLMPPILIVQHMPKGFTKSFAQRLNEICSLEVKEAEDRERIKKGLVLIAPGDYHLLLKKDLNQKKYYVKLRKGGYVCHNRPSVEVLFRSIAREVGGNAIGVILTGMGNDGAKGLLEMKKKGALTIAQDENSSIVFGMPRAAIILGAVDKILPLEKIPQELVSISYNI